MTLRTSYVLAHNTLVIDLRRPHRMLSSAPRGGGVRRARYVLNHQVPLHPQGGNQHWGDPARYLGKLAVTLGIKGPCVGLMTGVSIKDVVIRREETDGLWVEGFLTVGVSNAVRAGEPVEAQRHEHVGTINIIVRTNAALPTAALVGVVQVVTESKTVALIDECVLTSTRHLATGTGTDATVVISGEEQHVRYSGTHTKLGELVGRVVYAGVVEGLKRYRQWLEASRSDGRPRRQNGRERP